MKMIAYTLTLLVLALPIHAQQWKEVQRLDKNAKPLSYTDTMYVYYLDKDSASLRINGFQYNIPIKDKRINLAFTNFLVQKNEAEHIVLERGNGWQHQFQKAKTSQVSIQPLPVDDIAKRVKAQDKTPITINGNLWQNNWKAYKRESPSGPVANLDFKTVIKRVVLKEPVADGLGFMKLGSESSYLFKIHKIEQSKFIVSDPLGKQYSFHIYGLTERELVFEDHRGLVYYCNKE